jgi:hypothetical protein
MKPLISRNGKEDEEEQQEKIFARVDRAITHVYSNTWRKNAAVEPFVQKVTLPC